MTEEPKYGFVNIDPESVEFRAFLRLKSDSDEIVVHNVWKSALFLLGNPPKEVALCVVLYGEPDQYEQMSLAFDLNQARAMCQALSELLEQVNS